MARDEALTAFDTLAAVAPNFPGPFQFVTGEAGCLHGDTVVEYKRGLRKGGRPITLADLYIRFNGQPDRYTWEDRTLPTFLQSIGEDEGLFYNRIVAVYQSGVKPLVRVAFNDARTICATHDHPILTANGFVPAAALTEGQTVIARGSMHPQAHDGPDSGGYPPRVIVTVKYHPYGSLKVVRYAGVGGPVDSVREYLYTRVARARLVVEAALNDIPYDEFVHALKHNPAVVTRLRFIPPDFEVHHVDENTLNDDLSNLQVLTKAEHARLHDRRANFRFEHIREITVRRITEIAPTMTYDVQMESPANNFAANGVMVHNCGKTTLIRAWARHADGAGILLCATTGIAAVNLGEAVTVHSTLKFYNTDSLEDSFINGHLQARMRKLRASGVTRYCIDEVSMLPARQLTVLVQAVEELNSDAAVAMGHEPSIGLTLIGDFLQLPPVKEDYAFLSPEWPKFAPHVLRLTELHRQADPDFIAALRAVRKGEPGPAIELLRSHIFPTQDRAFDGVTVLAKNEQVIRFNKLRHQSLPGAYTIFKNTTTGKPLSEWLKEIPIQVELKPGAQVMILANKYMGGLGDAAPTLIYANGDRGTFVEGDLGKKLAYVQLTRTGLIVPVSYNVRQNLRPTGAKGKKKDAYEVLGEMEYMPLRLAYSISVHKCVAPDTRIAVHGRGYIPIADAHVGDHTPYGEIRTLTKTEQLAWRVTTKRGYTVVCSPEHRWQTARGLVATQDLQQTDRVGLHPYIPFPGLNQLSTDLAWYLGLLVGDGCYSDRTRNQVHFACIDHAQGERFRVATLRLFGIKAAWRKDKRGLVWASKQHRATLHTLGLDYVKGPAKRIPPGVWYESPDVRSAFLRGLYDTDGHIGRNRIILTTASPHLATDVQDMLLTLGIVSKRTGYLGVQDRPYWQVYVGTESFEQFGRLVGFTHDAKAAKLRLSKPVRIMQSSLGFDAVHTVAALGEILPMYDIEIPAPHLLGFGPFLGHNSQSLTLDQVQVDISDPFFTAPAMCYVALSRARSLAGLRLVGNPQLLAKRCTVDRAVEQWK